MDGELQSPQAAALAVVGLIYLFIYLFEVHQQTTASFLSLSSFGIHMFFTEVWRKTSTGRDFHQEKPDCGSQLCLQNDPDFDKNLEERNSEF